MWSCPVANKQQQHNNNFRLGITQPQYLTTETKMHLKYLTTAILATTAVANPVEVRDVQAMNAATAQSMLAEMQGKGCDVTSRLSECGKISLTSSECVLALAGTTAACTAAIAEGGLNPIADALCIFSIKDGSDKKPCKGCLPCKSKTC